MLFDSSFFYLFILIVFWSFHYVINIKKTYLFLINLVITNKSCKMISISSIPNVKVFDMRGKIMKTLLIYDLII